RILANRAKTRGQREGRTVPFSALDDPDSEQHAVDPDRFLSSGPRAGWWSSPPAPWGIPEDHLAIRELLDCIRMTIDDLPPRQRRRCERHIGECDGCTAYLEQMRVTIELTSRLRTADVPPEALEPLLVAFRDWHAAGA